MSKKLTATDAARDVLARGFYGVPQHRRLDAQSAQLVLTVAERLNEENRAKLDALPLLKAARLCWRLVER